MADNQQILVGKIVAPQGIRGEVRIQTFTEKPSDFQNLTVFGKNIAAHSLKFVRAVPNANVVIAKIDGITTRNMAENLRGIELFVERDSLPMLNDDEYYQADLIGLTVVRGDIVLGRVAGFQNFGAGDIIELDNGEMVAFRGAVVDLENNKITVK